MDAFKVLLGLVFRALAVPVGLLLIAGCGGVGADCVDDDESEFERRVSERAEWLMTNYPESRLLDLYKNFFHDKFGPGHMINDTASAGAYIRRELMLVDGPSQVSRVEITGWEGEYVRVDLYVLKEGTVDYRQFFDAFIESAQRAVQPSVNEWSIEWEKIQQIIAKIYPDIPEFAKDSLFLENLLSSGKYVVHHSDAYSKAYQPHYRLFNKDVFERRLSHLLDSLQ